MAKITKESVYEEVKKGGIKGKRLSAQSKLPFLEQLVREGKIQKIDSKYYDSGIIPTPEEVYEKVKRAAWNGIPLLPLEVHKVQNLMRDEKVKKVGKKYYLSLYEPLTQKKVIEKLLTSGYLKKSGKKYVIMEPGDVPPESLPPKVPSFFEFVKTLQHVYLRKAQSYRQGVNILSLIEALVSEMNVSEALAKNWILELPRIFAGIVDLRPFPGERGLTLKDGTEVSRIYLERGIVGL